MLTMLFLQLALANAGSFTGTKTEINTTPVTALVSVQSEPAHIVAGLDDRNALDILNNTRPDILHRGAVNGCPVVTALYVNGKRREAPAVSEGFSSLTVYVVGDTVKVMLPRSVADALRTVAANDVDDIVYVDCTAPSSTTAARNALYITTK